MFQSIIKAANNMKEEEESGMFIITRVDGKERICCAEAYNFISESNYIEININFRRVGKCLLKETRKLGIHDKFPACSSGSRMHEIFQILDAEVSFRRKH